MVSKKRDLVRVNLNLPSNLVDMLDDYASQKGINRTMAIIWLCSHALANDKKER